MGLLKTLGNIGKGALGVIMPTAASLLPGPLGGIAKKVVTDALGLEPDSSEDQIEEALANTDPAKLIELKRIDAKLQADIANAKLDIEKVHAADRASARQREVQLKDWMPKVLAFLVVGGYVGLQWFILGHELPPGSKDIILRSFGIIEGAVLTVLVYYFGSSAGSTRKTELMNGKK